ncbi:MAG TPA: cytochrome c biogenesis heme-transporting ATPase CcmA [Gammaproteobacteria bacterium]|nr:cytochrome c biogenesis heme-transporting ATPase CcmA [Gammaproteobacteria bacterium]
MSGPTTTPLTLSACGVAVWRGDRCLCRDLSFELHAGEALHVQGSNGAGKTSLIRVLAGLGRCDAGEVLWQGEPLRRSGATYRAAIGYLGHSNGVKLGLSPRENLAAACALRHAPPSADIDSTLAQVNLHACADMPCGALSMGQRRRAALARLLLAQVPLWFLDEPLASLDIAGTGLLHAMLDRHLSMGGLAVFATHQPLQLAPRPVQTLTLDGSA